MVFLLRIRQSEYGLMSMLGATKKQIGSLLLRETLSIGIIATIIGILIGFGLTALSSHYLMNLLGVQLHHWQSFSIKSIVTTLVFFIVLFTLNGLYNRRRLRKQDTLTLLLANKQVNQPKERKILDPLFGLIGLLLLIASFVLMPKIAKIGLSGFVVILILNIWGTYWFVSRTLKMVTSWVRGSKYSLRGLRAFINGQLSFRLPDYQRILSSIAVMFALALGAMSVGQGYYLMLPSQAEKGDPLTAAYVTNKISTDNLKGIAWNQSYHYVVKGQTIYFNAEEFNEQKLPAKVWSKDGSSWRTKWLTGNQLRDEPESDLTLTSVAN